MHNNKIMLRLQFHSTYSTRSFGRFLNGLLKDSAVMLLRRFPLRSLKMQTENKTVITIYLSDFMKTKPHEKLFTLSYQKTYR